MLLFSTSIATAADITLKASHQWPGGKLDLCDLAGSLGIDTHAVHLIDPAVRQQLAKDSRVRLSRGLFLSANTSTCLT